VLSVYLFKRVGGEKEWCSKKREKRKTGKKKRKTLKKKNGRIQLVTGTLVLFLSC
jgi:hypothetical protein